MAMTNHIKLARDFITAWEDKNLNQILNMMAENCKYHNIPMQPLEGHDNIKSFIAPVIEMSQKIVWDIHQIAEDDRGNVFTERTDKFLINDKWIELPVCGIMTFANGLITHWRDYFDLTTFEKAMEEATA
jgi:limonene-1,2-epoxide hydrolase